MGLYEEIFQQPAVMQRLLSAEGRISAVAQSIRERDVKYVFLVARGTSDNAGRYAKYLWGAFNGLPIALAAPSLFGVYRKPPRLQDALVVAISQSGRSPDIVSVVDEGRAQGALTLAITNAPDSPLARAADLVLDLQAGEEKAVAATKTYTAQLMTIAMLSAALSDEPGQREVLQRVPELVASALKLDGQISEVAERYRYMSQCVVLGRGYNYASAYEWSLKLKELTYVLAEPYSSADFRHGPIAVVNQGFPVLAIAPAGEVQPGMITLLETLAHERKAELLVISNDQRALSLAQTRLQITADLPEWISPLVGIVPAQLFAYYLTCAKGFDPDKPRGLSKVTQTR